MALKGNKGRLGKSVKAVETPREAWVNALQQMGFSQAVAELMASMTAITLDQTYELPDAPIRGTVTLQDYISTLVERSK